MAYRWDYSACCSPQIGINYVSPTDGWNVGERVIELTWGPPNPINPSTSPRGVATLPTRNHGDPHSIGISQTSSLLRPSPSLQWSCIAGSRRFLSVLRQEKPEVR